MANIFDLVDTWALSGGPYTSIKMNATDNDTGSASLLMDLQVGTVSKFSVSKAGTTTFSGNLQIANNGVYIEGTAVGTVRVPGAGGYFGFTTNSASTSSSTLDTFISRRAAANLRLGFTDAAAPVAQTLSVQSGTAGASALTSSISATTLTVGTVTGTIAVGHAITGTGVTAGTTIVSGAGSTWVVSASQTVSSTTMYFNSVGKDLTLTGSQGSGPSAGGSIIFQVAPAGSAATTAQNALADALRINANKSVTFVHANLRITADGGNGFSFAILDGAYNALTFDYANQRWVFERDYPIAIDASTNRTGLSIIRSDAANTLALRNAASAQRFNVYNTYTSSTNYEAFKIDWITTVNTVLVGTEKGSVGGTARALEFQTDGATRLTIAAAGPVTVSHTAGLVISNTGGNGFSTSNGGYIIFKSSGVLTLSDASDASFNRLQFGGTTAAFPAIKRNGAGIDVVGADGTNVSFVRVPGVAVASLPAAATAGVGARSFVTDANATTYASTVAGGGANKVPVFSDGTSWIIG